MTEQLFLKQFNQLPEGMKQELIRFLEFLLFKYKNQEQHNQAKHDKSSLSSLQQLLLEAPPMSNEEYNLIMEKRKALNKWN